MEYEATYGINGGVSHGFGTKHSDYYHTIDKISADSPEAVFSEAAELGRKHAEDHLSDPESGLTIVRLLRLQDSEGKVFSQKPLNSDPGVEFEGDLAIFKCSMLEHLLLGLRVLGERE